MSNIQDDPELEEGEIVADQEIQVISSDSEEKSSQFKKKSKSKSKYEYRPLQKPQEDRNRDSRGQKNFYSSNDKQDPRFSQRSTSHTNQDQKREASQIPLKDIQNPPKNQMQTNNPYPSNFPGPQQNPDPRVGRMNFPLQTPQNFPNIQNVPQQVIGNPLSQNTFQNSGQPLNSHMSQSPRNAFQSNFNPTSMNPQQSHFMPMRPNPLPNPQQNLQHGVQPNFQVNLQSNIQPNLQPNFQQQQQPQNFMMQQNPQMNQGPRNQLFPQLQQQQQYPQQQQQQQQQFHPQQQQQPIQPGLQFQGNQNVPNMMPIQPQGDRNVPNISPQFGQPIQNPLPNEAPQFFTPMNRGPIQQNFPAPVNVYQPQQNQVLLQQQQQHQQIPTQHHQNQPFQMVPGPQLQPIQNQPMQNIMPQQGYNMQGQRPQQLPQMNPMDNQNRMQGPPFIQGQGTPNQLLPNPSFRPNEFVINQPIQQFQPQFQGQHQQQKNLITPSSFESRREPESKSPPSNSNRVPSDDIVEIIEDPRKEKQREEESPNKEKQSNFRRQLDPNIEKILNLQSEQIESSPEPAPKRLLPFTIDIAPIAEVTVSENDPNKEKKLEASRGVEGTEKFYRVLGFERSFRTQEKNLLEKLEKFLITDEKEKEAKADKEKEKEQEEEKKVEEVAAEPDEFNYDSRYFMKNPTQVCYRCRKPGHVEKWCTEDLVQKCMFCLEAHRMEECQQVICFNCSGMGHRRVDCRIRENVTCFRCGKKGHKNYRCGVLLPKERETLKKEKKDYNISTKCPTCKQYGHAFCPSSFTKFTNGCFDDLYMQESRQVSDQGHSDDEDNREMAEPPIRKKQKTDETILIDDD